MKFNRSPAGARAAGVDLSQTHDRCDEGQTPGMHMEDRRDGHVHIVPVQATLRSRRCQRGDRGQGVKHQLPVAEEHAFGQAGGAGRMEHGRPRIFVEIRDIEMRWGGMKQ